MDKQYDHLKIPAIVKPKGEVGKLPEEEKEKDRALVHGIPVILARAGYAIEKV